MKTLILFLIYLVTYNVYCQNEYEKYNEFIDSIIIDFKLQSNPKAKLFFNQKVYAQKSYPGTIRIKIPISIDTTGFDKVVKVPDSIDFSELELKLDSKKIKKGNIKTKNRNHYQIVLFSPVRINSTTSFYSVIITNNDMSVDYRVFRNDSGKLEFCSYRIWFD